jgi:hypothetical protein
MTQRLYNLSCHVAKTREMTSLGISETAVSTSGNNSSGVATAYLWHNQTEKRCKAMGQGYMLREEFVFVLLRSIYQWPPLNCVSKHCQDEEYIFSVGIFFYLDSISNLMMARSAAQSALLPSSDFEEECQV